MHYSNHGDVLYAHVDNNSTVVDILPDIASKCTSLVVEEGVTGVNLRGAGFSHYTLPNSLKYIKGVNRDVVVKSVRASSNTNGIVELVKDNIEEVDLMWNESYDAKLTDDGVLLLSSQSCKVVPIAKWAVSKVKEIVILGSFEIIPPRAFKDYTSLLKVRIEAPIHTIGSQAFIRCSALSSVELPYTLREIGTEAFSCCRELCEITLPPNLKIIKTNAFHRCSSLTEIVLPSRLKECKTGIFSYCSKLEKVQWGSSMSQIPADTFAHCTALKEVSIPSSVSRIGASAFKYCTSLPDIPHMSNVRTFPKDAFLGCTGFVSITIPEGIAGLHINSFLGCSNLVSVRVPTSMRNLPRMYFPANVEMLASTNIPYMLSKLPNHRVVNYIVNNKITEPFILMPILRSIVDEVPEVKSILEVLHSE